VEGSDGTTWVVVRDEKRKTSDEGVGWWKRTQDNIDKNTDADQDGDGH